MKRAFTLIEQLAALALGAVFMSVSVAVLAGIGRDRNVHRGSRPSAAFTRAAQLIQRDLADSRRFRVGTDEIILTGFASLNPSDFAQTHRPVRITYRIEGDGDARRLVRRQEALDVLGNRNTWSELVCEDVGTLNLISLSAPQPPAAHPWADPFSPSDGQEIPSRCRLLLTHARLPSPGLDQVLCVR